MTAEDLQEVAALWLVVARLDHFLDHHGIEIAHQHPELTSDINILRQATTTVRDLREERERRRNGQEVGLE